MEPITLDREEDMEMTPITLKGDSTGASTSHRISYLTTLLNNAESAFTHIDSIRQKHLTIALVIFAGLFGFGVKSGRSVSPVFVSVTLTLLMLLFTVLDRRLHRLRHGWRETRKVFILRLSDVMNMPAEDVSFLYYYAEAEKKAEFRSLLPVLFYLLAVGGLVSCPIFYWASKWVAQ